MKSSRGKRTRSSQLEKKKDSKHSLKVQNRELEANWSRKPSARQSLDLPTQQTTDHYKYGNNGYTNNYFKGILRQCDHSHGKHSGGWQKYGGVPKRSIEFYTNDYGTQKYTSRSASNYKSRKKKKKSNVIQNDDLVNMQEDEQPQDQDQTEDIEDDYVELMPTPEGNNIGEIQRCEFQSKNIKEWRRLNMAKLKVVNGVSLGREARKAFQYIQKIEKESFRDRVFGVILGSFVGNACGSSVYSMRKRPSDAEVEHCIKLGGGGRAQIGQGQVGPESEMQICLLMAIVGTNMHSTATPNKENVLDLDVVTREYSNWLQTSPYECDVASYLSLKNCDYAMKASSNAQKMNSTTLTNGAITRIVPLSIWTSTLKTSEEVKYTVVSDVELSHANRVVQELVFVYCETIRFLLINYQDSERALKAFEYAHKLTGAKSGLAGTSSNIDGFNCSDLLKLALSLSYRANNSTINDSDILSKHYSCLEGQTGPENHAQSIKHPFVLSFYFLLRSSKYQDLDLFYDKVIRETVKLGGDTAANACVVGGLIGALVGVHRLSFKMLTQLFSFDDITSGLNRDGLFCVHETLLKKVDQLILLRPKKKLIVLKDMSEDYKQESELTSSVENESKPLEIKSQNQSFVKQVYQSFQSQKRQTLCWDDSLCCGMCSSPYDAYNIQQTERGQVFYRKFDEDLMIGEESDVGLEKYDLKPIKINVQNDVMNSSARPRNIQFTKLSRNDNPFAVANNKMVSSSHADFLQNKQIKKQVSDIDHLDTASEQKINKSGSFNRSSSLFAYNQQPEQFSPLKRDSVRQKLKASPLSYSFKFQRQFTDRKNLRSNSEAKNYQDKEWRIYPNLRQVTFNMQQEAEALRDNSDNQSASTYRRKLRHRHAYLINNYYLEHTEQEKQAEKKQIQNKFSALMPKNKAEANVIEQLGLQIRHSMKKPQVQQLEYSENEFTFSRRLGSFVQANNKQAMNVN